MSKIGRKIKQTLLELDIWFQTVTFFFTYFEFYFYIVPQFQDFPDLSFEFLYVGAFQVKRKRKQGKYSKIRRLIYLIRQIGSNELQ